MRCWKSVAKTKYAENLALSGDTCAYCSIGPKKASRQTIKKRKTSSHIEQTAESLKHQVKSMDHDLAIKNNTAERYLLGELTEMEMEAYEEHFFSCTACAQEVKLGSQFIEDAREV